MAEKIYLQCQKFAMEQTGFPPPDELLKGFTEE